MPRFCPNCGNEVDPSWRVCQKCGNTLELEAPSQPAPQPYIAPGAPPYGAPQQSPMGAQQYPTYQKYPSAKPNQRGTTALICGVIGIFCCSICLGPLAIYFGNKGLKEDQNKSMAQIGLVLGIIDIVCFFISLLLLPVLLSSLYY